MKVLPSRRKYKYWFDSSQKSKQPKQQNVIMKNVTKYCSKNELDI